MGKCRLSTLPGGECYRADIHHFEVDEEYCTAGTWKILPCFDVCPIPSMMKPPSLSLAEELVYAITGFRDVDDNVHPALIEKVTAVLARRGVADWKE